jgi:hypothetical protein
MIKQSSKSHETQNASKISRNPAQTMHIDPATQRRQNLGFRTAQIGAPQRSKLGSSCAIGSTA